VSFAHGAGKLLTTFIEGLQMATKAKNRAVSDRIMRWRRLANQWLENHRSEIGDDDFELKKPPDFTKRITFSKKITSFEKRGILLPLVNYLYENDDLNPAETLAAWEMLGRLVIHNTVADAEYCGEGDEGIRSAQRLLGEPVSYHFDLKLRDVPMPDEFESSDRTLSGLRITITNSRGVVISERIKPDTITTDVEDY
jgi:hypothetical protein